jgi:hypothetical protein
MVERERERREELCAQAIIEKDPQKLIELTEEINRVLEKKQRRVEEGQPRKTGQTPSIP